MKVPLRASEKNDGSNDPRVRESKQIRKEANRVVDEIRKANGLPPIKKELKALVNFEAEDTPPAHESLDR